MSLKAVHIVLVVVATIVIASSGAWLMQQALASGSAIDWMVAISACSAALALPVYGMRFLNGTRDVGYV
ncbi:MAG: hypothetical protein AAF560_00665 [Acidobacteriota bacterium]